MLTPGAEVPPSEIRYPGIVERLAKIYRESADYGLRYSIISLMIPQAERAAAIAFLEEVAAEEPQRPVSVPGVAVVDDSWPLQNEAIGALLYLGPPGRAALQRLHAQGTVREPMARATLDNLARQGFPDPRKR
jgi:hypothetical protein